MENPAKPQTVGVEPDSLLTRHEVRRGLAAKRARALLYLIETRTARLVAHRQVVVLAAMPSDAGPSPAGFDADPLIDEPPQAGVAGFLQALRLWREPVFRPSIRDLERYAEEWAHLVPANPQLRAVVAHLMGEKYRFSYEAVPDLRAALGLDGETVRKAYRRLYGEPLENIYAPSTGPGERVHRASSALGRWLESLPPFWTAFALTLTCNLPTSFLALPIAVAGIGPLSGIGLVLILGALNFLTTACMAEAVARSGSLRYGSAFSGRLAADLLGSVGSCVLTGAIASIMLLVLLAAYLGTSVALTEFTGVPAAAWVGLHFVILLLMLPRIRLSISVLALLGSANIAVILALALYSAGRIRPELLIQDRLLFLASRQLEPAAMQSAIGVTTVSFVVQAMVPQVARIVLPRDSGARSFIWGSAAGTLGLTGLLCIWVLALNGSIAPERLSSERGTILAPLTAQLGAVGTALGSFLLVVQLGLTSVRASTLLGTLVRERLPAQRPSGEIWQLLLAASPVAAVFVVAEWLLVNRVGSFAGVLSVCGILSVTLIAGAFPVLLLVASRRKGEVALCGVARFLGHPLMAGSIYLVFLAIVFLHGLVIWRTPAERAAALLVGLLMIGATVAMVRAGAFARRVVVELRADAADSGRGAFAITAAGRPVPAVAQLRYAAGPRYCESADGEVPDFGALREARIRLPAAAARELKVWVHRTTPEGDSEGLPALLELDGSCETKRYELGRPGGQALLPLTGTERWLGIALQEPRGRASWGRE